MDSLGQRIVHYRKKAGFLQKELAAAIGITPTALNYYEKDKREPTVLVLANLADALGITGDALLGREHPDLIAKNKTEYSLLRAHRNLNNLGQERVLEYASDLSGLAKYTEK
jgi:transcriptional regulator with XRE-family HTH domain